MLGVDCQVHATAAGFGNPAGAFTEYCRCVHLLIQKRRDFTHDTPNTPQPSARNRVGSLLFRLRSLTPIPFILLLIYFSQPTPISITIGTPLLILGEWLRIWAVGYAGGGTRSRTLGAARDLVTAGPYAYVRNPLYLGNLLLSLSVCCIANVWWLIVILLVGYFAQYAPIIASEEAYLAKTCGDVYHAYFAAVGRFIPRLRPYPNRSTHDFSLARALKSEKRTLTAIVFVVALIVGRSFL